ncbi:DUF2799 domain-containing protein [Photobacterium sanctipauli]|uniref:DUF2799 domain-containing protein n=1 Tax=Photobacterium sanctipauli TaxID=1342794 RepID=A0A2T3NX14_9GAMM|nr:DUF2799 domain-containing protein [Photobacterium sanctipauli]PSW20824.1 DUF2799 domain-containing protein [Photobacterium sanctipauli]
MKLITAILASIFLFGCSATDTQLAKQDQWEQLGFNDGARGKHQRSATELTFLTVVDQDQVEKYNNGFVRGNAQFCNLDTAYENGLYGKKYQGQCFDYEHEPELVSAWHKGYERYVIMRETFEVSSSD